MVSTGVDVGVEVGEEDTSVVPRAPETSVLETGAGSVVAQKFNDAGAALVNVKNSGRAAHLFIDFNEGVTRIEWRKTVK